jgi:membrane-associated protein
MYLIRLFIDYILHMDKHMGAVITYCGHWTYVLFFVIIFCETGLVVTPFLPGDSLLFAIGAFAALGALDLNWVLFLLALAAVTGNLANYGIGKIVGPKIFHAENVRFLNKEYLEKTHRFYEHHGGKTIIITRFLPIFRTFAPFVAGIGAMTFGRFFIYNLIGGLAWVCLFVLGGYYFGNLPIVKRNFTIVIMAIIIISVLPAVIEFLRQKMKHEQA